MLLSFVLPVYNVEKYLARCLDSILAQDLPADRYEIILVNDSSPDSSRRVAEQYAAEHPDIHILDQAPNGGPGAARNRGIAHARGEYVWSVDPDDYLEPGVLGALAAELAAVKPDMLALECRARDEQDAPIEWICAPHIRVRDEGVLTGRDYMLTNQYPQPLHEWIIRRAFIAGNGLKMLGDNIHEDTDFTPRALAAAARVKHYPRVVYNYVRHQDSTMGAYRMRNLRSMMEVCASLSQYERERLGGDPQLRDHFRRIISLNLYNVFRRNEKERLTDTAALIREARERGMLPMANPRGHLNRFLINRSTGAYLLFNRYVRKPK